MTIFAEHLRELAAQNGGTLPAYAWPGGYPVIYTAADGDTLCARCADAAMNPFLGNEDVVAWNEHLEGPPERCADCGIDIHSAYGPLPEDSPAEQRAWARYQTMADYRSDAWHRGFLASVAREGSRAVILAMPRGIAYGAAVGRGFRIAERFAAEDAYTARERSQLARDGGARR